MCDQVRGDQSSHSLLCSLGMLTVVFREYQQRVVKQLQGCVAAVSLAVPARPWPCCIFLAATTSPSQARLRRSGARLRRAALSAALRIRTALLALLKRSSKQQFLYSSNSRMSEKSFKIKCSKSSSARRFSLSKPTLAGLSNHVEASWGASGPSFWYVDDDGDRIEVLDDNDFQAASSQLRSSCICLNVDFVSDQIEFKPSKNHDSLASSSSETSNEDDGFISVELYGDAPLLPPFVPHVTASLDTHAPGSQQEQNSDHEGLVCDYPPNFQEASSLGIAQIETQREDQVQDAAHVAYLGKIASAVEDMVTSSGMGFTSDSFRAAVESVDAESLKLMIRKALLLSSCVSQVQAIAQTAIMRMEH